MIYCHALVTSSWVVAYQVASSFWHSSPWLKMKGRGWGVWFLLTNGRQPLSFDVAMKTGAVVLTFLCQVTCHCYHLARHLRANRLHNRATNFRALNKVSLPNPQCKTDLPKKSTKKCSINLTSLSTRDGDATPHRLLRQTWFVGSFTFLGQQWQDQYVGS